MNTSGSLGAKLASGTGYKAGWSGLIARQSTSGMHPLRPPKTFGNGVQQIGTGGIPPGTYRNFSTDFCYGARLSGFSDDLDDIIANAIGGPPHMIVTIEPGDAGFESSLCNKPWSNDLRAIKSPGSSFGDGTYFVGSKVRPGTWQASNPTSFCYWERLSGFSWELDRD